MRSWILVALCNVALIGIACAQEPVEIADGRVFGDSPDLSEWLAQPAVQQAFGAARAYWRAQAEDYEEDARVMAVAKGAFTQPGTEQQAVLYLMSLWPRCCPKMGLAVLEGGRVVRNVAFEQSAQQLKTVPDLDSDGLDELALIGEFGMGGEVSRTLTLVEFEKQGLAERISAALYGSDCAASGNGGSMASRVLALPGPTFVAEPYTATCASEAWQAAGAAVPLEAAPPSATYTELPVR